ncbi:MAG TPA: AmmeMemoRadiSam system protein A [Mogibacterium sp.]|nr:AmmeMemoRadiSam system protein A [Mogibacterium sp.]
MISKKTEFGILKAYAVPHPPIVLPEIGRGEERKIEATSNALKQISREIAGLAPDTIILSSPHAPLYRDAFFLSFSKLDQGDLGAFGCPFVKEEVYNDLDLAEAILQKAEQQNIMIVPNSKPNKADHGSLVPLRFICKEYKDFKFVRIGLSLLDGKTHYRLGQIIAKAAEELKRRAVFIASGDLSHVLKKDGPYGFRPEGPQFDQMMTDILSRAAFDELLNIPKKLTESAAQCGLYSFQMMAGAFDGRDVESELLSYEGTFGVGYAVVRFVPQGENPERNFLEPQRTISNREGSMEDSYISLARHTIEEYVNKGIQPGLPENLPGEMIQKRAATFVSLHRNGQLRGCIGTLAPCRNSVASEIQYNAIAAATKDPRFRPLQPDELEDLEISVDVLLPAEKINSPEELDPKKYGVIVTSGYKRGVLLPNLEGIDTAEKQVAIACDKAGIRENENYYLERFEVIRYE